MEKDSSQEQTEFLICGGVLFVRECTQMLCFRPSGEQLKGTHTAVMMRPATLDEVAEYQEQTKCHPKTNSPT
jgi:hypothetical protein